MKAIIEPLGGIFAVLLIALFFGSLPQVNRQVRVKALYRLAFLMLITATFSCDHIGKLPDEAAKKDYQIVLIFNIAVGYICVYIATMLRYKVLKSQNNPLEKAWFHSVKNCLIKRSSVFLSTLHSLAILRLETFSIKSSWIRFSFP